MRFSSFQRHFNIGYDIEKICFSRQIDLNTITQPLLVWNGPRKWRRHFQHKSHNQLTRHFPHKIRKQTIWFVASEWATREWIHERIERKKNIFSCNTFDQILSHKTHNNSMKWGGRARERVGKQGKKIDTHLLIAADCCIYYSQTLRGRQSFLVEVKAMYLN